MNSFPILSMLVTREHDVVAVRQRARQIAQLVVADKGPGIQDLNEVLTGRYHSATGMGVEMASALRAAVTRAIHPVNT